MPLPLMGQFPIRELIRTWNAYCWPISLLLALEYPHKVLPEIAMLNRGRISIRATWAMLMVLLSPYVARACSIVYPNVRVGSRFRVRVTDRGRPVRALRLVLSSSESSESKRVVTIYLLTDADGYAGFSNLSPGQFFLTSDHDFSGIEDGVGVEVTPNGPANVTVPLKWPGATPVSVRSVSCLLYTSPSPRDS